MGGVGGAVGGTPPSGDPELLEAPKAPKNVFWPKLTCAEGARENFDWLQTRRKILPNHLRRGGGVGRWVRGGWGGVRPLPPTPPPPEMLSCEAKLWGGIPLGCRFVWGGGGG